MASRFVFNHFVKSTTAASVNDVPWLYCSGQVKLATVL